MVAWKLSSLLVLSLRALHAFAAIEVSSSAAHGRGLNLLIVLL